MLKEYIPENWLDVLGHEIHKDYFYKLDNFLIEEYNNKDIQPSKNNIFKALEYSSYNNVKVVILGQDPYPTKGDANGLAFSVSKGVKVPRSLKNIYKELKDDLNLDICVDGDLSKWAKQGVLLLNTVLTIEVGDTNSHSKKGWEIFTDIIISKLNERNKPIIFILWGNFARSKKKIITNKIHYIIESAHPSPLSASRGFFGSKPFSKANKILNDNKIKEIDWSL